MNLHAQLRRLKTAITEPTPQATSGPLRFALGTVKTVTAGAALDGNAAVVVTVSGNDLPAPYDAGYTPTVGHVVWVLLNGGSPFIGGHVIGQPVI